MKNLIILVLITIASCKTIAQVPSQPVLSDSQFHSFSDSILSNKAKYIGQPLSVLFTDIRVKFDFPAPTNLSTRKKGLGYYKITTIYIDNTTAGFDIELQNRVPINYDRSMPREGIDGMVRGILSNAILIKLEKHP